MKMFLFVQMDEDDEEEEEVVGVRLVRVMIVKDVM
jgi:hypothetical protein